MAALTVPSGGLVSVDAQILIYSVEKHPLYYPLLRPLWSAVQARTIEVATSELSILECLTGPLKAGDSALVSAFELFFQVPALRLVPVSAGVLRDAAGLRATISKLKSPDAIHAATALREHCAMFVTNDFAFRSIPGLPAVILDDALHTP